MSNASSPSRGSSTLNEDDKRDIKNRTAELSQLFLGIRQNLINDSMDSWKEGFNGLHTTNGLLNDDPSKVPSTKKFSSATLVRAERVKFTLTMQYSLIRRSIELKRTDPATNKPMYPNVEGLYNPLQVIRNRKLYKKYDQYPHRLDLKIITPASSLFSEVKSRKLKWQVDLSEMLHDLNFRSQHFNELKTPTETYWFPDSQAEGRETRLHEKLFEFNVGDADNIRIGRTKTKSTSSRSSSKKQRRFSKSPISIFGHSSLRQHRDQLQPPQSQDYLSPQFNNFETTSSQSHELHSSSSSSNLLQSPIKNINIKSYKERELERDPELEREIDEEVQIYKSKQDVQKIYEDDRKFLIKQTNMLKMVQSAIVLGEYNLINKPTVLQNKIDHFLKLKSKMLDNIDSEFQKFNSDVQKFESKVINVNESTLIYKLHLSNTYSNKIDLLISLSDRTIGEINTSLTLETRRLRERLEKLDSNLYQSLTSDSSNDYLIQFIYYILENLIALLLLFIWFFYKIFKISKIALFSIIRLFHWLIE